MSANDSVAHTEVNIVQTTTTTKATPSAGKRDDNSWTAGAIISAILFFMGFCFPPLWIIGFFYNRSTNDREYFWSTMNVSACAMFSFMVYVVAWFTWIWFMYMTTSAASGDDARTYYLLFMATDANSVAHNIEPGEFVAILYGVVMTGILGYEFVKYIVKLRFMRKLLKKCNCCGN